MVLKGMDITVKNVQVKACVYIIKGNIDAKNAARDYALMVN